MVRLKLMPPLTRIVGQKEVAVDVGRASLRAVIERAAAGNGKFRAAMLDAEGGLSAEYSCLINGRRYNVSDLDGVEVDETDEIVLLMPIAGGAPSLTAGEQGCWGDAETRGRADAGTRWKTEGEQRRRGEEVRLMAARSCWNPRLGNISSRVATLLAGLAEKRGDRRRLAIGTRSD